MPGIDPPTVAARWLFWATLWLVVVLVAVKACYLGAPSMRAIDAVGDYLRSLASISYGDVLFAATLWIVARSALALAGARRRAAGTITVAFLLLAALSCTYTLASVVVFGVFGGFLTYPMLALIGDVRMLSSSASAYLTRGIVAGLVALPLAYVALVLATVHFVPRSSAAWRPGGSVAVASLGLWLFVGHHGFATEWATKQDRRIADNPQWVLLSSWWQVVNGKNTVRMIDRFPPDDLADFAPLGMRPPSPALVLRRLATPVRKAGAPVGQRPLNVIIIVLESVAARWTGLSGGHYETTPNLKTEAAHALMFNNFYAHIGRSSNSLAAMLLSTYPKLDFTDFTAEFPHPAATSLAAVFRDRGYRTAFMTPSYLSWAGWETFLKGGGFAELHDATGLPCTPPLSSWGVEDRCMVDEMVRWLDQDAKRPFFLMTWPDQTHHPYEPTPGVPSLDLLRETGPDDYDLGRYLNVLHETDHQLERVFEAIRRNGIEDDTLVVVVGDHGQAFGAPHDAYTQGRFVYEEDVHVPLLIWSPRLYRSAVISDRIGSHVDLAPTIAALTGIPVAPDWQGRSLFDPMRSERAYFYAAEDHFTLGVREGNWKYIFDLREGADELYDLDRDPTEQHNLARAEPERSARFRQRLAAWTEANRRQYIPVSH